jgi:hypothetical protein
MRNLWITTIMWANGWNKLTALNESSGSRNRLALRISKKFIHVVFYISTFYKPFYVFDRFTLRDVYFSLWGNIFVPSYFRFQATDLHKFGLVGKALAHTWFLTFICPLNGTVVCVRLKKSKNHIKLYIN